LENRSGQRAILCRLYRADFLGCDFFDAHSKHRVARADDKRKVAEIGFAVAPLPFNLSLEQNFLAAMKPNRREFLRTAGLGFGALG